jgi:hypothetical protein
MFTILGALCVEVKRGFLSEKENEMKQILSKARNSAKSFFEFMVLIFEIIFLGAAGKLHFVG